MNNYYVRFTNRMGMTWNGIVYVNTGGRVITGPDVESAARSQARNFWDTIVVPDFNYTNTPQETIQGDQTMSASIWCDIDDTRTNYPNQIGHPFSSRDTGRRNMQLTDFTDDGKANIIQGDICGYHAKRNPLFNPKAYELLSGDSEVDSRNEQ